MSLRPQVRARLRRRFVGGLFGLLDRMRTLDAQLATGAPTALAELRTIGHRLAGTGSSFGLPRLSTLGRALEHAPDEQVRPALAALMDAIGDVLRSEEKDPPPSSPTSPSSP